MEWKDQCMGREQGRKKESNVYGRNEQGKKGRWRRTSARGYFDGRVGIGAWEEDEAEVETETERGKTKHSLLNVWFDALLLLERDAGILLLQKFE